MDSQTLKESFNTFIQHKSFSEEEILLRKKSLSAFELPLSSNEEWHYTPLKLLGDQKVNEFEARPYIDQIEKVEGDASVFELCFVNGCYVEKFSNFGNLQVMPLNKNIEKLNLQNKWLEALNLAFFENGLFIEIKKNQIVNKPILIRHYFNTQSKEFMASPRVLVLLNECSEANITEIFEDGSNEDYYINDVTEFRLSNNSKINYLRVINESEGSVHTGHINAELLKDSKFNSVVVGKGAKLSRHQQKIILKESGAEANLSGVSILKNNRFEQNIEIAHIATQTTSSQNFKFILNGKSRGAFQGKVNIESTAQRSSANQLNKNVLLSKKAHMDTKPQLDVYADDVKATHGATVGQLDEAEKFYLQSRGLSIEDANRMLCEGFVFSTANKIKDKWQKERISMWLKKSLEEIL